MQIINIENKQIAYSDCGTGTPLLLIHGFAEDHRIWRKLIPKLEQTNRVICVDIPGSGESSSIHSNTTIEALADMICLFLKGLKIDKCIIMGHSMGGYIALALLEKNPECLTAIGLIHSTSYADDDNKKQTREKAIAFMDKHGCKTFLETAIPDLYKNQSDNMYDIKDHIEMGIASGVSSLQAYYRAMIQRPDRSDVLRSSKIPVLFVCGSHDKSIPINQSLKQSYLANETHIHILKHSAHMGMIEETDVLIKAIQNFIHHTIKFIS